MNIVLLEFFKFLKSFYILSTISHEHFRTSKNVMIGGWRCTASVALKLQRELYTHIDVTLVSCFIIKDNTVAEL